MTGAWRAEPPPVEMDAQSLALITPLLLRSGGGGLGWRQVRGGDLGATEAGAELQQAYRLHCLQAALSEKRIGQILRHLREAGVEPLLIKGWSNARLYPEAGLRPFGDIDLVIRPEHFAIAESVIRRHPDPNFPIDLHARAAHYEIRDPEELFARSQIVRLGEVEVRIPGPEDHLRLITLHMLCHGAWRPLWLCDIAAAVEARPREFDWERCLSGNRREADWVACGIGLAGRLLGADLANTPIERRAGRLPGWLVRAVLRRWDVCEGASLRSPFIASLIGQRNLGALWREMRFRWDRPIQATLDIGAPFNNLPRMPIQVAALCLRGPELVRRFRQNGQ